MKEFIAYCGLDCETCQACIATENDDEALLRIPWVRRAAGCADSGSSLLFSSECISVRKACKCFEWKDSHVFS